MGVTSREEASSLSVNLSGGGATAAEIVSPNTQTISYLLIALVGVASVGGFLFGYDTGVISGAMIELKAPGGLSDEGLSLSSQEVIVSSAVAAAAFGSLLAGFAQRSRHIGRRRAILVCSFLFAAGSFTMALARSQWMFTLGRIVVGLAVGAASQVVPVFVAEVSPPHIRGTLNAINTAMVVFGQVTASGVCCGYAHLDLASGELGGWRWMLGWGALPALCMGLGVLFIPESPRWLAYTRLDEAAALRALERLRGSPSAARRELAEISVAIAAEECGGGSQRLLHRLASRRVGRALALGVGVQLLQQAVGINTIMYYSATILQMAHGGGREVSFSFSGQHRRGLTDSDVSDVCWTVPIAFCQFVGTIIGMLFIDRVGRRPLTLCSLVIVSASLTALGFSFHPDVNVGWLSLVGMCTYLVAFGIGMSPMPWVVNAEIYPADVRSVANSLATTSNWIANSVVSATFLHLAEALSTHQHSPSEHPDGAFWLYAVIALVGLALLTRFMPETRGKSLEEMDALF